MRCGPDKHAILPIQTILLVLYALYLSSSKEITIQYMMFPQIESQLNIQ